MSEEKEEVYQVTAANMQELGTRLAAMQSLNAMNTGKSGDILEIHLYGAQWPVVFIGGEMKQQVLDLLFRLHKQEIEKLTKKPPIDTAG